MTKQLSYCCKAGIKLTGKDRPNAFACEKCGRIIGTPLVTEEQIRLELNKELRLLDEAFGPLYREAEAGIVEDAHVKAAQTLRTAIQQERASVLDEISEVVSIYRKTCKHSKSRKGLCRHDIVANKLLAVKHRVEYKNGLSEEGILRASLTEEKAEGK